MTTMTPARMLAVFDQLALEASLFRKDRKTECAEFASESASARATLAALIADNDLLRRVQASMATEAVALIEREAALAKRVAELEADAARLEFMANHGISLRHDSSSSVQGWFLLAPYHTGIVCVDSRHRFPKSYRAAIDAARAEARNG